MGRSGWIVVMLATLCFGCGSGSSTGPSPAPVPTPSPSPAPTPPTVAQFRLDGTIADALSKSGISATVDLLTASGTLVAETTTDTSGRFTFGLVSAGNYVLRASATGYESSAETISLGSNLNVGMGL